MTAIPKNKVSISVVVPVLNETETIKGAMKALGQLREGNPVEVIVVDGGLEAETLRALEGCEWAVKATSRRGRGRQMNEGASHASGELILFLHADTRLPPDAFRHVQSLMGDGRFVAGAFDLGIASERRVFRVVEAVASARSRLTRIPYGDQAIFIRKDYFKGLGGYRDIPLMEDVDLMRRIRRKGDRICFIPEKVSTSARRWEREGILYATLRNWTLVTLFLLGVGPEKLARFYR